MPASIPHRRGPQGRAQNVSAMQLTQEAYAREIERHATWNLVVNLVDITFFNLAMSFIFGATVLTLYASHLTNSALLVGLVPTVQNLAFVLPQLLMSRQTRAPAREKVAAGARQPYRAPALFVDRLADPVRPQPAPDAHVWHSAVLAGPGLRRRRHRRTRLEEHAFQSGARQPPRFHVWREQRVGQPAGPGRSLVVAPHAGHAALSKALCVCLSAVLCLPDHLVLVCRPESRAAARGRGRRRVGQRVLAATAARAAAQPQLFAGIWPPGC